MLFIHFKRLLKPYRDCSCHIILFRRLICLLVAFFLLVPVRAQSLNYSHSLTYSITWKDKSVGQIHAVRKSVNDKCQYIFDSHVRVSLLKEFNVYTSYQSLYQAGCLQQASAQNQVNRKIKSHTQIRKQGSNYLVNKEGTESVLDVTGIEHSLTTLYFREPIGLTHVFSERYAAFLPLEPLEAHRYAVTLPDGNTNYYTYSDGICTLVEVHDGLFTFHFKLLH